MPSRVAKVLVPVIIGLALFGFATFMVKDPTGLLRTLIFSAIMLGVIFVVYRFFLRDRLSGVDQGYHKAAKQSAKRQKRRQRARARARAPHLRVVGSNPHRLKRQRPKGEQKEEQHLTVIEGRKNKRKNRALF